MGEIISQFAGAFVSLILGLLNLLPTSPTSSMVDKIQEINILPYINWFIPFQWALDVLIIWTTCINSYYLFIYAKSVLKKLNLL